MVWELFWGVKSITSRLRSSTRHLTISSRDSLPSKAVSTAEWRFRNPRLAPFDSSILNEATEPLRATVSSNGGHRYGSVDIRSSGLAPFSGAHETSASPPQTQCRRLSPCPSPMSVSCLFMSQPLSMSNRSNSCERGSQAKEGPILLS